MGGVLRRLWRAGLLASVLAALVAVSAATSYADDGLIGVVKKAEGSVFLLRSDQRHPVAAGDDVRLLDRLRTGPDGAVGVTLTDGTLISLGPNSVFEFTEFEYAPQRDAFGFLGALLGGTMLYSSGNVGKLAPERTRVRTPLSVISVRGTRFGVRLPAATGD